MRKEVIFAVIIGIILGGVILYGINLANNSASPKDEASQNSNNSESKSPEKNNTTHQILISTPQNNSVTTEESISLKGSAKPGANIAIISENDDILTATDSKSNFSSTISLISGENRITVTAVDDKQATVSASIYVIRTATLPE